MSKTAPALLALTLLLIQAALPWTARRFATQDGSSHVYTARVARDLLLDRSSPYAAVYTLDAKQLTNWTATLILAILPPEYAERCMASLCVLLGFFGFAYLRRSLDPETGGWSPLLNFLLSAYFLWIGFYNFYLGIALVAFVAGYYIRYGEKMNARRIAILAGELLALLFTHALAYGLALTSVVALAFWRALSGRAFDQIRGPMARMAAAVLPGLLAAAVYLRGSYQGTTFDPNVTFAWNAFPLSAFASSAGRTGAQEMLVPAMLFYMAIAALGMSRSEFSSARGGIFAVAAVFFLLYLFTPDTAFGGGGIKIRMAWVVFLFGCIAASTVAKLRVLHLPVSVYVTCFLTATLLHAMKNNVRNVSRATEAYAAAMEKIPPGARFVRLRFPADAVKRRFGIESLVADPLYHFEAAIAAQRRLVDLSDYRRSRELSWCDTGRRSRRKNSSHYGSSRPRVRIRPRR